MISPAYNSLDKLLHWLALGSGTFLELTFDIERNLYSGKNSPPADGNHVFVSGLARAGTTILMRTLHQTGEFSSLTYRDMPFVLAPNTWAGITSRSRRVVGDAERSHGDGILVNPDSPEALEEVFWRVFGGQYIQKDKLVRVELPESTFENLRAYVNLINRRYGKKRYLSKNNNNVLRLDGLVWAFPNATILLPFRDPVAHSCSLLNQHIRFTELHRHDRFAKKYMAWLAHYEFGCDHRPFEWGASAAEEYPKTDPEYWLKQWIGVYGFLSQQVSEDSTHCIFVCHELMCRESHKAWAGICRNLNIQGHQNLADNFTSRKGKQTHIRPGHLLDEAYSIYEDLKRRSTDRLLS